MTTLTPDQILDFRGDAGDTDTSALFVSDARIQGFYDSAALLGEDSDTTYAIVMVKIITRMLGELAKRVDLNGQVENEQRSQWFDHLKKDLLPMWQGMAGISGAGSINAGTLSLGIDFDDEDFLEATEWPV